MKLSPLSARTLEAGIPVRKSTGCTVIHCGYLLCKVSGSDEIEMALLQVFFLTGNSQQVMSTNQELIVTTLINETKSLKEYFGPWKFVFYILCTQGFISHSYSCI